MLGEVAAAVVEELFQSDSFKKDVKATPDHAQVGDQDDNEHGEMDILQFGINAGNSPPQKLPTWRMPLIVQQEVVHQLNDIQRAGVIQPSCSPWSSPVIVVCKKDKTHRFCIDYRHIYAVTKPDTFLIMDRQDPDVNMAKVYFPQDKTIQVHQM